MRNIHSSIIILLAIIFVSYCCKDFCVRFNRQANLQMRIVTPHDEFKSLFLRTASVASHLAGVKLGLYFYNENSIYSKKHQNLFQNYILQNSEVLEIGFGDGANIEYYPSGTRLIGLDPNVRDSYNIKSSSTKFNGVIKGFSESLPFQSESFDAVVSTLVFCSVTNPNLALEEISRVLRKGGIFISVEHILSHDSSALAFQQTLLDPLQQKLADGCHLTRQTDELFRKSVPTLFTKLEQLEYIDLPGQWPISSQIFAALRK